MVWLENLATTQGTCRRFHLLFFSSEECRHPVSRVIDRTWNLTLTNPGKKKSGKSVKSSSNVGRICMSATANISRSATCVSSGHDNWRRGTGLPARKRATKPGTNAFAIVDILFSVVHHAGVLHIHESRHQVLLKKSDKSMVGCKGDGSFPCSRSISERLVRRGVRVTVILRFPCLLILSSLRKTDPPLLPCLNLDSAPG
jgi:hypothetical protein